MPKVVSGKLSDALWAQVESRLAADGKTVNSLLVELLEDYVAPKVPRVPQKLPRVPPKRAPAVPPKMEIPSTYTGMCRKADRLLRDGEPVPASLAQAIENFDVAIQCWDATRRDELQQIRCNLLEHKIVLDTFHRGCLSAADEEAGLTLPTVNESTKADLDDEGD